MAPKNQKGPRFGKLDVFAEEYGPKPIPSKLSLDARFETCRSVAAECIKDEELRALLEAKEHPVAYDGFEPSGRMHIAQGILKAINVNKLTDSGCVFVFWVADWFAMMNNKMGGDMSKIRKVGQYFIEVWKASGMKMDNVRFIWTSEEINKDPDGYWMRVMNIAMNSSISRVKRCGQIMGRAEGDEQPAAQIFYPVMQAADIFYIGADICQLGMDQRKVNMLARDYCDSVKMRFKPVILSHGMVPGLIEGQEKMSKSNPDSAIFMEDSNADIKRKVKRAFCPLGDASDANPCVQYVEQFVFGKFGKFDVVRSDENGGNKTYESVAEFKADVESSSLHPGDLKAALTEALIKMITPVREHFENDPDAKKLLAEIKKFQVSK
eukprot:GHVH01001494.1.p1 GENE.GHVH01001494.1~~GHVH01001494.1.p1  ORF type:complete len:380 (-),score=65.58 GHVH01001494.1:37-1176(-)